MAICLENHLKQMKIGTTFNNIKCRFIVIGQIIPHTYLVEHTNTSSMSVFRVDEVFAKLYYCFIY